MRGFGRVAKWSLLALGCAGVLACAGDDLVLSVDVKTDFVPGTEFVQVRTEVTRPTEAGGGGGIETSQSASRAAMFGDDFLNGRRVAELTLPEAGTYLVRASLHDASGALVVARTVRVDVRESYGLIMLLTRSCTGVECPAAGDSPDATACLGGRCVPEACSPLAPESCGTAECESDAGCVARVSCAEGRCENGYCLQVPLAGACPAGQWCSVERGCVALMMEAPDGGGSCVPATEECNGLDDDCDGRIDEEGTCPPTCDAAHADCDGDTSNGCEADLSSASSCGACGIACSAPTPLCALTGTTYACASDCPPGAPTLCGSSCVDVATSPAHCGGCDMACAAPTSACAGGTCVACGECEPPMMQSEACGMCGTRSRACDGSCSWGGWSACGGEGACSPGVMEMRPCGNCGTQSRVCTSACGWGGWSACAGEGACSPGAVDTSACGNCGTHSRTCAATCSWDGYGACGGEGACSPSATTSSGCVNTCQRQTCSATCSYPGTCTACGCTNFYQCGLSCSSPYHVTAFSRSSACGSGTLNNQVRCDPDCGSSFYKCAIGCTSGYHATAYSRSSACGSGTINNQTRCDLDGGASFYKCEIGCPSAYHPTAYSRSSACGSGTIDNQTRCDANTGSSFYSCGLTCPSGYHPTSFSRSSACGSGTSNNQVRCDIG